MYPGEMTFTRMFFVAHSTAREDAMWRTAAFEALYGACGWGLCRIASALALERRMKNQHVDDGTTHRTDEND